MTTVGKSAFQGQQITFIERLSSLSGMDPGVIAAQCYAEENGAAAASRAAQSNNNWLNIGYTGSGDYGTTDSVWASPDTAAAATYSWMKGNAIAGYGGGAPGIRAILSAAGKAPTAQIQAIQNSGWAGSGYGNLLSIYTELDPSFLRELRNGVPGVTTGGTAGLGGTGLPADDISNFPFTVGDASTPNEDYWTACNRLAQDRQWYFFGDGETIYLASGDKLIAQKPVLTINRIQDRDRIILLEFTWDNTAWQYAVNQVKANGNIQKRTALSTVQSPVEATLQVICDIDEVRAGDVVLLDGCGPGDGRWLVGDCTRSIFNVYSELTLVQALAPLNEIQAAGSGTPLLNGKQAAAPGAGTVISAIIQAINKITNQNLPYIWGGGHNPVGQPSTGTPNGAPAGDYNGFTQGYDCSGFVAAVMKGAGLWTTRSVGDDDDVISQMQASSLNHSPLLVPGQGNGSNIVNIFNIPGEHIYMSVNGRYAAARGHEYNPPVGWYQMGVVEPGSVAYHIPIGILESATATTTKINAAGVE